MKFTSFVLLAFCAFAVSALPTNVVPEEDFESPSQEPPNIPEKNPRQELTLLRKSVTHISKKIAIMETELEQKNAAPQVALVTGLVSSSTSTDICSTTSFNSDTEETKKKCIGNGEMKKLGIRMSRCECKKASNQESKCKGGTYITAAGKEVGGGFIRARDDCHCLLGTRCTSEIGGTKVSTEKSIYTQTTSAPTSAPTAPTPSPRATPRISATKVWVHKSDINANKKGACDDIQIKCAVEKHLFHAYCNDESETFGIQSKKFHNHSLCPARTSGTDKFYTDVDIRSCATAMVSNGPSRQLLFGPIAKTNSCTICVNDAKSKYCIKKRLLD